MKPFKKLSFYKPQRAIYSNTTSIGEKTMTDGTTLMDILTAFLKENGYDGLCNPEAECGCSIDNLFPCGEYQHGDCIVAYLGCAEDDPEEDWFYLSKQDAEDSMQRSPAFLFTEGCTR